MKSSGREVPHEGGTPGLNFWREESKTRFSGLERSVALFQRGIARYDGRQNLTPKAGRTEMAHAGRIRVLVAKPGLDGHDRGAKVIARALRDAGMEVIYTGLRQTPEMVVKTALQEDVQVIGLSILSGAHNAIVARIAGLLKEQKMDDVLLLVGGIIPDEDIAELKAAGVKKVFPPGTALDDIVRYILENTRENTRENTFVSENKAPRVSAA